VDARAGSGAYDRRLTVLALIHDADAGPGVFSGYDEVASFSLGSPPSGTHDAVMIFGGEANVDDPYEWLVAEKAWLAGLLEREVPVLGVCLGAQLIADVAGSEVLALPRAEVGWHEVEGSGDLLPTTFTAFEWHRYGFEKPPPGATELARNDAGCQAFALGNALGIQFHAEVDEATVDGWIRTYGPEVAVDEEALAAETKQKIGEWNAFGRGLCDRWLRSLRPAHPDAGRR
jgi:GMP synthase-like glutamine amidotransferase